MTNDKKQHQNQDELQSHLAPLHKKGKEELSISDNDTNFIFNGGEEITEFEQKRKLYSENSPKE
ncbi:hypothetical protein ACFP56_05395 [Paenibacillus septentrionalis]|uniref:YfhD family protein n=1 Tax=Paenibacillus septentrionalis TaxID=429342 RepID=A0ABW1V3Q0_9BACL